MTVGFARVGRGEALDISLPYDEVLVVTKGVLAGDEIYDRAAEHGAQGLRVGCHSGDLGRPEHVGEGEAAFDADQRREAVRVAIGG
jgi:hypothetical protein